MLNLDAVIDSSKVREIMDYTRTRFSDSSTLMTPEALTLYEQNYLPRDTIKELCEKAYNYELYEPQKSFIPASIIEAFYKTNVVPVTCASISHKITALYVPELERDEVEYPNHSIELLPTTLYYFLELYQEYYGVHPMLKEVPAKKLTNMIIRDAIDKGAAELTLSTMHNRTIIYYNICKRKCYSNYIIPQESINDILKIIAPAYSIADRKPKYVGADLNGGSHRGRILINRKIRGHEITIRLFSKDLFADSIETLGFADATKEWIYKDMLDMQAGLRLFVGPTFSGKNTTCLACIKEINRSDKWKIVSVEMPVEQEIACVEQIDCETIDEYVSNVQSLIHQNPDFVYITEMREETGKEVLYTTNTGKRVLSTLHSNGVADTLSRLINVTGLDMDTILQSLHSICYQELIRDEENNKLVPKNRYLRFTDELKYELYGKELGSIIRIVKEREGGDEWTYAEVTK